ncbi:MAG: hypothetical protein RBR78_10810 [Flavobacteriaceae bacterium]|jgi:hypothetical protein|nr:hypothetical protein [Flavobacteriaceae bacterium]
MESKFKVNDNVKHVETREVYKVIEVTKGKYGFLYKLKAIDNIVIDEEFQEAELEAVIKLT